MKQTVHEPRNTTGDRDDDRRTGKRVALSYPIRVSGSDDAGHSFSDLAVTTDVSEQGCRFDLLRELSLGSIVTIHIVSRNSGKPQDHRKSQFKIAWVSPSPRGWTIGALILNPANIWRMAFPKRSKVDVS